jgi:hypothetical protein
MPAIDEININLEPLMKNTLARITFCAATLLCTVAWNANANLVANPGFETGNFSGWTVNDPSGFTGVGNDAAFAHSGSHYAFLGATPNTGSLSQSLTTVAGTFYTLSFYLANDMTPGLGPTTAFEVFWNGASVLALPGNSPVFGYTNFTISGLVATGGATTLEFRYRHDNDFWRLDDCSVTVPESASTIWLALPTFAALGLVYSRKVRGKNLARA